MCRRTKLTLHDLMMRTSFSTDEFTLCFATQARHVADLLHVTLAALGVNEDLAKAQEVCRDECCGAVACVSQAWTLRALELWRPDARCQ